MKNHYKKVVSLFIILSLLLTNKSIANAVSIDTDETEYQYHNVLPSSLTSWLTQNNVDVTNDLIVRTKTSSLPTSNEYLLYELSIKQEKSSGIVEDIFLCLISSETAKTLLINSPSAFSSQSGARSIQSSTLILFPTEAWGISEMTIHATAYYTKRYNGIAYYHPEGHSFYYVKHQSCTVSHIGLTYYCGGGKYTYPGFVFSGEDIYENDIDINYPSNNLTYANYTPYHSDYVIECSGQYGGHRMDFSFTINNIETEYPYTIFG